jgi:hypothetical protein
MVLDNPYGENATSGSLPMPSFASKILPVIIIFLISCSFDFSITSRHALLLAAKAPAISKSGLL